MAILMLALTVGLGAQSLASPVPGDRPPESEFGAVVHELRLDLSPEAAGALRLSPRDYVHASLRADGMDFRDVGVHLKGATGSFRPLDDKPALTLALDRFDPDAKFCGLTKLHLDNAVEDPGYLGEFLGSEVFRAAGLPAPQVTHALVWLNGRRLGLYVLREGFAEEFRRRSFGPGPGFLLEPERGQDVDGQMQVKGGRTTAEAGRLLLRPLNAALNEPDPARRWQRLEAVLDLDRFVTLMAVEVLLGHRDGYTLAKNNFRLHVDAATGKVVFLPHGMDQLFASADLPVEPQMAGLVARTLMELPAGRQRYRERLTTLSAQLLQVAALTNRVNEVAARLGRRVTPTEAVDLAAEAGRFGGRIERRAVSVRQQLSNARPLEFQQGRALLKAWAALDTPAGGRLSAETDTDGNKGLRIVAGPATAAAWSATVRLDPGRYRFAGCVRTTGVKPLPFGQHQGAALRVSGERPRSAGMLGDSAEQPAAVEFTVGLPGEEIQLRCELRASSGEAWFDAASLRLEQLD